MELHQLNAVELRKDAESHYLGFKNLGLGYFQLVDVTVYSDPSRDRCMSVTEMGDAFVSKSKDPFDVAPSKVLGLLDDRTTYLREDCGFEFFDAALIDTHQQTVMPWSSDLGKTPPIPVSVSADPILYWELSSAVEPTLLRRFITETFFQASIKLGFEISCDALNSEMLSGEVMPDVLMRTPEFELIAKANSLGENTVDSKNVEAAGSLLPRHGFKPMLVLLHLQEAYEIEFHESLEPLVSFSDAEAVHFAWTNFSSIDPFIKSFNADRAIVRDAAAKLGLCMEAIHLDRIECDEENFFF